MFTEEASFWDESSSAKQCLIQVANRIVGLMSEGDRSAVDVFLSSGPMRIVVLEVHNPSPEVKCWKGWVIPRARKANLCQGWRVDKNAPKMGSQGPVYI